MAIIKYGSSHYYGSGHYYREDLGGTGMGSGGGGATRPVSRRERDALLRGLFNERKEEEAEEVLFIIELLDMVDNLN